MIVIRERSFMDLLDLALKVVRDRPVILGLSALAGIVPFAVLNIYLLSDPSFPRLFWVALLVMETPWATAPLTLALGELMFDVTPRPWRMLKTLVVSLPALVIDQVLVRGLLLLFVVFYPVVPSRYAFLDEVILLERAGPFRAPKRSRTISQGCEGELFLRWMGQIALGSTFAICFWMGAETIGSSLWGQELTWYRPGLSDLGGLLFQVGIWVAIAYFGVVRFLSYIDRRTRLEGWEIELRLKAVGRSLEERPS
jgi:hypothetical protein